MVAAITLKICKWMHSFKISIGLDSYMKMAHDEKKIINCAFGDIRMELEVVMLREIAKIKDSMTSSYVKCG